MIMIIANMSPDITPPTIPALSTRGLLFNPAPVADSTRSTNNQNNSNILSDSNSNFLQNTYTSVGV